MPCWAVPSCCPDAPGLVLRVCRHVASPMHPQLPRSTGWQVLSAASCPRCPDQDVPPKTARQLLPLEGSLHTRLFINSDFIPMSPQRGHHSCCPQHPNSSWTRREGCGLYRGTAEPGVGSSLPAPVGSQHSSTGKPLAR